MTDSLSEPVVKAESKRGRPRVSPLSRTEQIRHAQKRYRDRLRTRGKAAVQLYLPDTLVQRLDQLCVLEGGSRSEVIARVLEQSMDYLLLEKHAQRASYLPPLSTYGKRQAEVHAAAFAGKRSPQWVRGFFHGILAHYYPQTAAKSRAAAGLLGPSGLKGYGFAEKLIRKYGRVPPSQELVTLAAHAAGGEEAGGDRDAQP